MFCVLPYVRPCDCYEGEMKNLDKEETMRSLQNLFSPFFAVFINIITVRIRVMLPFVTNKIAFTYSNRHNVQMYDL